MIESQPGGVQLFGGKFESGWKSFSKLRATARKCLANDHRRNWRWRFWSDASLHFIINEDYNKLCGCYNAGILYFAPDSAMSIPSITGCGRTREHVKGQKFFAWDERNNRDREMEARLQNSEVLILKPLYLVVLPL